MIYLQILRAVAIVAFVAGAYWLAMYHHQDSTVAQNLLVFVPLAAVALTNYLIIRARKART